MATTSVNPVVVGGEEPMNEEQLLALGRERGYVTLEEIMVVFPEAENDVDRLDEVFTMLMENGIEVGERVRDAVQREVGNHIQVSEQVGAFGVESVGTADGDGLGARIDTAGGDAILLEDFPEGPPLPQESHLSTHQWKHPVPQVEFLSSRLGS